MREDIMTTYKELKAIKESFDLAQEKPATKFYWVGTDECGIMVVTLNIRDIRGLDNVHTIEAANSFQARVNYAAFMNSEGQASTYFESL